MILPGFIDEKQESLPLSREIRCKPQIFREKKTSASFRKDAGVAKDLQFVVVQEAVKVS